LTINPLNTTRSTLILGASINPERYAFKAAKLLLAKGYPINLVGIKKGSIENNEINTDKTIIYQNVDTITLYIGAQHQEEWFDYIIKTKPKRIIFNPGTENNALELLATANKIAFEHACTLVLLNTNQY
jgi:predicted CoA-binding protein